MKKLVLLIVALTTVIMATVPVALSNDPQPPTTDELMWDNGTYDDALVGGINRAVWFIMPFDAQVITARVYIALIASDPGASFDMLLCPRDGGGMPDDGNPYGTGSITASGGTAGAWFDVDVSSLGVNLSSGDEFYLCYYTVSEPDSAYDTGSDGSHNAWDGGAGWSGSSYPAYMFRVIVDDGISQVELSTWGAIKALDN